MDNNNQTPNDGGFDESKKVKVEYNNIKFGMKGDWFRGTLTANSRQIRNNLSAQKEMQTVFEFKARGGSFHDIVKKQIQTTPRIIQKGEFWSYITSKPALLNQLKKAQLGQIIGFRFSDSKPSKIAGQDDAKIIDVYLEEMDAEYQGETAADQK